MAKLVGDKPNYTSHTTDNKHKDSESRQNPEPEILKHLSRQPTVAQTSCDGFSLHVFMERLILASELRGAVYVKTRGEAASTPERRTECSSLPYTLHSLDATA